MIENVTINNYRSFRRLRAEGLTRVNLFVGRNNVGKTSLLDALDLYVQRATPEALWRASDRRRESRYVEGGDAEATGSWHEGVLDLRLLIHGRELKAGVGLSIEGDDGSLRCTVEKGPNGQGKTSSSVLSYRAVPELSGHEDGLTIPLAGTRLAWSLHRFRDFSGNAWTRDDAGADAPVRFLGTFADPVSQLSADWNSIALTDGEDAVVRALRTLEPEIERIAYLGGGGVSLDPQGFVVTFGKAKTRVPIGSLGDGIKRILAVTVNAVTASGGALFVDEIDTGLHHSAMLSMWRSLVSVAHAQNVQVFATTHSLDCVYALGQLVAEGAETSSAVALHRIERDEERTVRYSGAEIAAAARSGMEVR